MINLEHCDMKRNLTNEKVFCTVFFIALLFMAKQSLASVNNIDEFIYFQDYNENITSNSNNFKNNNNGVNNGNQFTVKTGFGADLNIEEQAATGTDDNQLNAIFNPTRRGTGGFILSDNMIMTNMTKEYLSSSQERGNYWATLLYKLKTHDMNGLEKTNTQLANSRIKEINTNVNI
jgi:hypothetical protein